MSYQHASLAEGRWFTMPLMEQLAHVGSEVGRILRWKEKNPQDCEQAFLRALELLDLTIQDPRWKGRRKELTRVREFLCDAMLGENAQRSDLIDLDRYFYYYAMASRIDR